MVDCLVFGEIHISFPESAGSLFYCYIGSEINLELLLPDTCEVVMDEDDYLFGKRKL